MFSLPLLATWAAIATRRSVPRKKTCCQIAYPALVESSTRARGLLDLGEAQLLVVLVVLRMISPSTFGLKVAACLAMRRHSAIAPVAGPAAAAAAATAGDAGGTDP
jgi:hypothetical protein